MNIKTLITTLVLGSSSVAMAKPVTVSGHASVSVNFNTTSTRPVVRDHRVIVDDDCTDGPIAQPVYPRPVYTQPVYTQPVYQPLPPIYSEPFWSPTNSRVAASGSTYIGTIGRGNIQLREYAWRNPQARSWFTLTEATRIDSGRQFINLDKWAGARFTQLRLQSAGGRTDIAQVAIEYIHDGVSHTQKVKLATSLARTNAMASITLDGDSRDINRIIVYGTSNRGAAYQIFAM